MRTARRLNMSVGICVFVIAVLAGMDAASGKTITVDPNGSFDFTTIQAAISDGGTVNGDEIKVRPGTYYERINLSGKAIRLYSSDGP